MRGLFQFSPFAALFCALCCGLVHRKTSGFLQVVDRRFDKVVGRTALSNRGNWMLVVAKLPHWGNLFGRFSGRPDNAV